MRRRPLWVVVTVTDGKIIRTEERDHRVSALRTLVRMPSRGWREAQARLPDGTVVAGKRRRRIGPSEFVFDRSLPPGTQISFAARRPVALPREQWFEREPG